MSQQVEGATKTFQCGAAIDQYLRVKLSSGKLAAAGVGDDDLGILCEESFADLDYRSVRLMNAQGTHKMVAAGAISQGARVFQAASGKINDVSAGKPIGVALEAATVNNDVIEVLIVPSPQPNVIEHHTASDTLTAGESGSTHTNLGAAGAITFTLPQDAGAGCVFKFCVMAAQELRVDPGAAGAIYINGAKQTDDKYISADDEAEHVTLTCDGNGDWIAGPYNGTFTVES